MPEISQGTQVIASRFPDTQGIMANRIAIRQRNKNQQGIGMPKVWI